MQVILGIDVGGSTTKIVGFTLEGICIGMKQVIASDQVTSLYGAIGAFLSEHKIELSQVKQMVLTGMGASYVGDRIYGIEAIKLEEFLPIGRGGLYLTGLSEAYVVSIGTGTALVRATKEKCEHAGGSGVGGGTLMGLSDLLFHENRFEVIKEMSLAGNPELVDMTIGDITRDEISTLPANFTASNFGKIKASARRNDIAAGLVNMVLQTAGMLAVFACRNDTIKNIVFTGSLAEMPQNEKMCELLGQLHGLNFYLPKHSIFATAIGAAGYARIDGESDGIFFERMKKHNSMNL
jgi:type II pantothenate kinase